MNDETSKKIDGHLLALSISAGTVSTLTALGNKDNLSYNLKRIEEYIKCQLSEVREIKRLLEKT